MLNEQSDVTTLPLYRKRVLIADDVELNQYIAQKLLESWGCEVTLAANGFEALEMLKGQHFDCILMDIRMPEMDGVEATRQIRQLADNNKAHVPIIAVTANAFKEDGELYMEAGMNAYVAKPIDENKLFLVMSQNIPKPGTEQPKQSSSRTTSAANDSNAKLYDLAMVHSISGGDSAFVKKMIALFIETVPANVSEMKANLATANWEQVSKLAHKLKSTIDAMGIKVLKQDIRTIEADAKQGLSLDAIPALIHKVDETVQACVRQLQADFS